MEGPFALDPAKLPAPLRKLAEKEIHRWALGWAKDRAVKLAAKKAEGTRHLFFAICDHYEPLHHDATLAAGQERVRAWRERYPELAARFRDADGRPPRHSYFFPGEEYDPGFIEPLAEMCEMRLGEVEVHLHHDG